ncbi:hypothetical protein EV182_003103 [Spiromyces aspiralis]|uniref:Uncharacterized protein n=1 Tax=Spiromyces aspiralis TaxID=68401 RepID=A0ACC1HDW6_9FUNG|nr:hypothetical protein EV182_003103 [Spiromyces aspiralis]
MLVSTTTLLCIAAASLATSTVAAPSGTVKGLAGLDGAFPTRKSVAQYRSRQVQSERLDKCRYRRCADRQRAEAIKRGFLHGWRQYHKYAFGTDELEPLTKEPKTTRNNWGATMVDALDTLWIMGLHDEFEEVRDRVADLNFKDGGGQLAKVFETNIRYVGGLLSAYELSGDHVFLKKATELADVLLQAFDTPTGVPWQMLDVETGKGSSESGEGSSTNLAEIGTFQLEFFKLSQLTRNPKYHQAAQQVIDVILRNEPSTDSEFKVDGLYPTSFDTLSGKFTGGKASWGALGDSFYEYLVKTWILSDFKTQRNRDLWYLVVDAFQKYLVKEGTDRRLYIGLSDGMDYNPTQDIFTCFAPGTIALGARILNNTEHLALAEELTEACYNVLRSTATNLGAEQYGFLPGGTDASSYGLDSSHEAEAKVRGFYTLNPQYYMRPEVIESIFYMYRITGDNKYRDWAWKIWKGIQANCRVDGGYAGIKDVNKGRSAGYVNGQESFVYAETLKYLYLIFADPSVISLDDYVFNTEAHPFTRNITFDGSF